MLTDEQRAVLAHIVIDPDAWLAHAVDTFGPDAGERFLAAKVAGATPDYLAARAALGADYRTRAERERTLASP